MGESPRAPHPFSRQVLSIRQGRIMSTTFDQDMETPRPECQLDLALQRVQEQGGGEKEISGAKFNASW